MPPVWEKIKKTFSSSAESLKSEAGNIAKTVADKTPEMTNKITGKAKEIASMVADKTGEAVSYSKLKLQIRNLNNDVEKAMGMLGGHAWELYARNEKSLYDDPGIIAGLEEIKKLKHQIAEAEQKLSELGAKEDKTRQAEENSDV